MSLKNDDKKITLIILIVALLMLTFFPLLHVKYAAYDDMKTALRPLLSGNFTLKEALINAKDSGRAFFVINLYLAQLPYLIDNYVFYFIISYGIILIEIILFAYLIYRISKSYQYSLLIIVFYAVFIQFSFDYNLITTNPFVFHFGYSMLLLSFIQFDKYLETGKRRYQTVSLIAQFISLTIYEVYILYFVFFPCLYLFRNRIKYNQKKEYIIKISKALLPQAICVFIYLFIYYGFRKLFGSAYDGNSIGTITANGFIKTLYQFSVSSLPTYIFSKYTMLFHSFADTFSNNDNSLIYILKNAKVEWILKSILGSYLFYLLLKEKYNILNFKKYISIVVISIFLYIMPGLLPAITYKYEKLVMDGVLSGYTVTYFSFFGVILFLTSTIIYIYQFISKFRIASKVYLVFILSVFTIFCIKVDYSNYYVAKVQTLSQYKWSTLNKFLQTEEFLSIPNNSIIYAPTLWNYMGVAGIGAHEDTYWNDYIKGKTGKVVFLTNNYEKMVNEEKDKGTEDLNIYFLKYVQESKDTNQYIIFSKMKKFDNNLQQNSFYSDNFNILSYSKYKKFSTFFNLTDKNKSKKVYVDKKYIKTDKTDSCSLKIDKESVNSDINDTYINVSDDMIDLESIVLSNYTEYEEKKASDIVTEFKGSFYNVESSGDASWRWSGKNSTISIENISNNDKEIAINMNLKTGFQEKSNLIIESNSFKDSILVNSTDTYYEKKILIPRNSKIEISFSSDAKILNSNSDPRELAFCLINFNVEE